MWRSHRVLTVGKSPVQVESALREGVLACPGCGGELRPWGHGVRRVIRTLACGVRLVLRPRRSRCRGCGVTHVLLPAHLLARRADEVAVIGRALGRAAAGEGYRRIAVAVGRSCWTVRSWVRRARGRAERLRSALAAWIVALDPDPPPLVASPTAWGEAVVVIAAVHRAAVARWPWLVGRVSAWEVAVAATDGSLLAPVLAVRVINTNLPLVTFGN
ncbi:DUF6431 domain-containing protein [Sphaerisporangium sp. NPDC051011]|uniref:DUF6431 domain-containing protein n=1 Tax=Sphaerisporangium sp. NPDC051011 TaxID=3155792 RepID=UPI003410619F